MALDPYESLAESLSEPSRNPFVITPHDFFEVSIVPKRIFIGTGGDITLRGIDGTADVVYKNVADGVYLNVRPQYVRATGTSAADIIGEG